MPLYAGCGVNVSNSEPTDCINDVIARHNQRLGTTLALLRKEVRVVRFLTHPLVPLAHPGKCFTTLTMLCECRSCWRQ